MPVVDGASPLVRPYLTAHEQQDRCRELAFMLLWQDCPGSYVNHVRHVSQGAEVA
ncbi:hypothetical protein [Streptomyces bluensis]|uniref:hypothetical protein n=1 Tax=Streptomyces bluensis TaxID=33897 RepID=UPI0033238CE7